MLGAALLWAAGLAGWLAEAQLVLQVDWNESATLPPPLQYPTVSLGDGLAADFTRWGHKGLDLSPAIEEGAPPLTGAVTVSVVVQIPERQGDRMPLVSKWQWQGTSGGRSFELGLMADGRPYFMVSGSGHNDAELREVYASHLLEPGKAFAVTGVFEPGRRLAVYVNGFLSGAVTSGVPIRLANPEVPIMLCIRPVNESPLRALIGRVRIEAAAASGLTVWQWAREQALDTLSGPISPYYAEEVLRAVYPTGVDVRQLTHPPGHHFFGHYDKNQIDPTGRYVLGLRVDFEDRHPTAEDVVEVGMIDLEEGDAWRRLGESRAWCWQQGCMLEWRSGHTNEVIWNDRIEDRFVCRVSNVLTGDERVLPKAVYDTTPDGRFAFRIDMARILDLWAAYGYVGVPDPYAADPAPEESGIWRMDMETGQTELLLSIATVAAFPSPGYSAGNRKHYLFNLQCDPEGRRLLFIDWAGYSTRLFTMNVDGSDLRFVSSQPSHYDWRDTSELVVWERGAYRLYPGEGGAGGRVLWGASNGHEQFLPYTDWIIANTYAVGPNREAYLYLFHLPSARFRPLAAFSLPGMYGSGDLRVDLHPRVSPDGRFAVVDSVAPDQGRQMYLVSLTDSTPSAPPVPEARLSIRTADLRVGESGEWVLSLETPLWAAELEATLAGGPGLAGRTSVGTVEPCGRRRGAHPGALGRISAPAEGGRGTVPHRSRRIDWSAIPSGQPGWNPHPSAGCPGAGELTGAGWPDPGGGGGTDPCLLGRWQ